jgi:hypothetical protein
MTHDRWHRAILARDVRPTLRHVIALYGVMEFRSEFWCSRNCSSTMRAFPGSSLRVIWYFYYTADRQPRSCDISFAHFRIFFIKTPIRVWLKASETSWFWKGLHIYFLQIVVFVWRINACRVYDNAGFQISTPALFIENQLMWCWDSDLL